MTVTVRTYRRPSGLRRLALGLRDLAMGLALGTAFTGFLFGCWLAGERWLR